MVKLPSLLLLLVATASFTTSQDDDPPATSSQSNSNTSTFRGNLVTRLAALPRAAAPTGFASLSSLGSATGSDNIAFVRGLCRGVAAPADCLANLQVAARNLSGSCAPSRRAAVWFDKAYVAYADTNATTAFEEEFRAVLYDVRKVADPSGFARAYDALMSRLVARASGGGKMFATGQAVYASGDPSGTMYGLMQCMRDRTAAECERCLRDSLLLGAAGMGGAGLRLLPTYYDLALDAPPPDSAASQPPPRTLAEGKHGKRRSATVVLAVALSTGTLLVLILIAVLVVRCVHNRRRTKENEIHPVTDNASTQEGSMYVKPAQFTLPLLRVATGNFAEENKVGEGGFGEVFKGKLQDGQAVAVKRLSQRSSQGFHELKNELELVSKLKHRNLVQLLGVCLGEQEKLIVYEYLPNRSLDTLLFDSGGRRWHSLDWKRRYTIISGITRALQYLHEESRLRIIHRDLKPSNILLDAELNPKISDFGGYMPPEYAYCGHVSTKSDMFSFGVIVLEIVTGRRNNSPYEDDANHAPNLLSYVWDKWKAGLVAEAVDASLGGQYPRAEMLNCVQVGLLCVQKKPALRPDASAVALMLQDSNFTSSWQAPSRPAYYTGATASGSVTISGRRQRRNSAGDYYNDGGFPRKRRPVSTNGVTISELEPR
uniref:non-specific serine/threonine protein kinase n=1 Tax=Leersia perrieri TaxID=77586 RepID=A0A0D9V6E7_9ORYZ